MIDEKRLALMNAEMDGETSPQESASLRTILAEDPEARVAFEDLSRLAGLLDAVPQVEPPPELKAGILRAIRPSAPPHREPVPRAGWWETLTRAFQAHGRFAWGYGFAAGLVLGLLGLALFRGGTPGLDRSEFVGSMRPLTSLTLLDAQSVDQDGVVGSLETRAGDGEVILRLQLDTAPPDLEVAVTYDPGSFRPTGFRQGGPPSHIALNDNELRFQFHGRQTTLLALSRLEGGRASEVHLRFRTSEHEFARTLTTGGPGS